MRFIDRHVNLKGLCLSDLINPQNNPDFYKTETVRKHLVLCYGLKCCYCEATISSTAYFHVDHFYPKSPPKINGQLQYPFLFYLHGIVLNKIRQVSLIPELRFPSKRYAGFHYSGFMVYFAPVYSLFESPSPSPAV